MRVDGADMDTVGERRAMSIGYRVLDADERTIEGTKVRLIRDVELAEVSIVQAAAVGKAYAVLVEGKGAPSLADDCRAGRVAYEGAAEGVRKALRRLAAAK